MARSRRRSTRSNVQKSPVSSPLSSRSNTPGTLEVPDAGPLQDNKDACPACANDSADYNSVFSKESWIRCDVCLTWYHWRCAGNGGDLDAVDKWYCAACMNADPTLAITLKAPARKSFRKRTQRDYANLNAGMGSDPNRWQRIAAEKTFKEDRFKRFKGEDVGLEWIEEDEDAMTEPIVIERTDGLGMKMPPSDFTVDDVAELVGEDTPIEVIDVASQSTSPGWTMGKWNDYFNLEPEAREKICNVISLEISGTKLSDLILPPRLVRELDWVENYWPSTRKGKGHVYPKVQLYCLMGVANAWTDWHIDFAGSSVYYHILHGSKVFYFIRPTPDNLAAYERWSGTDLQNHTWLGDMVDEVIKVELAQGNTMIIPTGWIHAVYTPVDTLVFGGNFLHSYDVAKQLRVWNIEISTQVPKKFRFPMFSKLCWYVGDKVLRDLKSPSGSPLPPRVQESMAALADFLVSEARTLERGSEQAKKEVKDQIPSDRVKDAPAMARELRWRLRLAAGYSSDDDGRRINRNGGELTNGNKRRRVSSASPSLDEALGPFKHFKPKAWDSVKTQTKTEEVRIEKKARPTDGEDWVDRWVNETQTNEDAEVTIRGEVVDKVRRTAKGVERQRIERVVEEWTWT
ncbi:JmjC domain-containing histone demethylation protein 1 [Hypsizygus marmoreus]|uniref:JmjC domain-containing histone demethylation protein 1 n=1 Tax=Hypsizygus marmoreus TaxID=39966 RepID=A0A369JI49_HYPMA|nr:JmjC domain-containing histone demethylation protein 1 [Hypsizygus marmoreus]